ncbi:MAG TPA: competence protein ComEA, partial [Syntrophomonas wolfei]|nr:competence protein ComEA [Syntrophomonas wolfei]
ALSQRIVDYREANGAFEKIEDIKNVSGIGEKKFEAIKEHITVR